AAGGVHRRLALGRRTQCPRSQFYSVISDQSLRSATVMASSEAEACYDSGNTSKISTLDPMAHPQQILPVASLEAFKGRIAARTAKLGVVGLGYVGLPLVLLYSDQRFAITGFDIDRKKVDTLSGGGSYIYRILPAEVQQAQGYGFAATA